MAVTVRFFANLRESFGISEDTIAHAEVNSVLDTWSKSTNGADMPVNILMAINMDYVDRDHKVEDGDEVAFFPPVTGG